MYEFCLSSCIYAHTFAVYRHCLRCFQSQAFLYLEAGEVATRSHLQEVASAHNISTQYLINDRKQQISSSQLVCLLIIISQEGTTKVIFLYHGIYVSQLGVVHFVTLRPVLRSCVDLVWFTNLMTLFEDIQINCIYIRGGTMWPLT